MVSDSVSRLRLWSFQSRNWSQYWDSDKSSLGLGLNIATQKNPVSVSVSKLRLRKLQSRTRFWNWDWKNTSFSLDLESPNLVLLITDLALDKMQSNKTCARLVYRWNYATSSNILFISFLPIKTFNGVSTTLFLCCGSFYSASTCQEGRKLETWCQSRVCKEKAISS